MTLTFEEVCSKYNVSESTLLNAFPRTQKSILKKHGVKLFKEGRGRAAVYREEVENDSRALTMYEETKNEIILDGESMQLISWEFMVFLAIVMTPMFVFRGSYEEFLKYAGVKPSIQNVLLLQGTLTSLSRKDFITYVVDKTDENYFLAAIYRAVEKKMKIEPEMIRTCKQLADENNKKSWVPLVKVWIGVQMLADEQPFTMDRLEAYTGLSKYQIRESKRILEKNDIFKTSRAYIDACRCIGTNVDLNGFYNQN